MLKAVKSFVSPWVAIPKLCSVSISGCYIVSNTVFPIIKRKTRRYTSS